MTPRRLDDQRSLLARYCECPEPAPDNLGDCAICRRLVPSHSYHDRSNS